MTQFNWQTEEDIVWEELPQPEPPAPPPNRRRRMIMLGVLLLVLIIAGLVVYWQVNRRVEAATQTIRDEVLASHNLVQRSIAEQDTDLLTSLMSGRDMGWVSGVNSLVSEEMYLARLAFDLEKRPFTPETAVGPTGVGPTSIGPTLTELDLNAAQITLSPDLTEAELTFFQPYTYQRDAASTGTVHLAQTQVYRLGADRWLYSPPQTDFWGDWQTIENDLLSVQFRTRDEEIVTRLAADLTAFVDDACQTVPDLACQAQDFVQLRFDSTPAALDSLRTLWEAPYTGEGELDVVLPTPTLVGLPVDEQGYEALLHGYARQLITAVILQQISWDCCRGRIFATTLIDYELSRLQLRSWPVSTDDYKTIAAGGGSFENLIFLHGAEQLPDDVPWRDIYAATDFLVQVNDELSPVGMLTELQGNGTNLLLWLRTIIPQDFVGDVTGDLLSNFSGALQLFAFTAQYDGAAVAPIAYPEQRLHQSCVAGNDPFGEVDETIVRGLSADRETWEELVTLPGYMLTASLPRGGLLLQTLGPIEEPEPPILWQNGRLETLRPDTELDLFALGETDPTGRYLSAFAFQPAQGPLHWAFDLTSCQAGECDQQQLVGDPTWSPDGQHGLFLVQDTGFVPSIRQSNSIFLFDAESSVAMEDMPLKLGLATGEPLSGEAELRDVGSGIAPFWVNDVTYGYLRLVDSDSSNNERELVLATIDDSEPQVILTNDAVAVTLADDEIADRLRFAYVLSDPTNDNRLYVAGLDRSEQVAYIWSFDRATSDLTLRLSLGYAFGHAFSISPNGRFLFLQGVGAGDSTNPNSNTVALLDLETGEEERFKRIPTFFIPSATYAWSADSQWLALVMTPNRVALKALEHDYIELIPAEGNNCLSVLWLD
ncbi:MAG: hypothetical protein AAF614_21230 [Chloroflexota bacterium]